MRRGVEIVYLTFSTLRCGKLPHANERDQMWIGLKKVASAASLTASDMVGCGMGRCGRGLPTSR